MRTLMNVMSNWRLMETPPAGIEGSPSSGPLVDEPTADIELFSDLVNHDEMEEPVPASDTPPVVVPPAENPPAGTPPPSGSPGLPSPTPPATVVPPAAAVPAVPPTADGTQQPPASGTPVEQPPPAPIDFEKHRTEFLPKLAELYQLSPEDVEAARTDPGKALPALAARVHYEVQHAVFAGVMNSLPQMVAMLSERTKEFDANESAFFTQFPTLKEKPEYAPVVMQSIQAVRASAPGITKDELMKRAGIMASLSLGLGVPGTTPPATPAPVPLARPSIAVQRPAGAGSVSHIPAPTPAGLSPQQSDLDGLIDAHLQGDI